jgi:serine protease Do
MHRPTLAIALAVLTLVPAALAQQQDRKTKVLGDRDRVEAGGFWIYNDLERGIKLARETGKPLLVTFRCIPCEHCAQLDERLVERDLSVQKLLEQFVCVRIVHANGMDLSLFQFDYDQSWAAFFLNADRSIYGRYGTRSHQRESENDMSLPGFAAALRGALEQHRQFPKNRAVLAGKQGPPSEFRAPEELPSLKGKYSSKLDYEGKVVQSCIHCHQVREGERLVFRLAGKPIPEKLLFPYPHPKILGLIPDPATRATLKTVTPGSAAEKAGFRAGDEIVTAQGQPVLSTADLQWVLHNAGDATSIQLEVRRDGRTLPVTLPLALGWRRKDDLSWRASSWDLRRMTTGGLLLEEATPEERRRAGLSDQAVALRAKHVGEYGEHAAAKNAGFQRDDVIVSVEGRTARMRETDLMAYLANEKRPGDRVPVSVLRKGERVNLMLPIQ